MQDYVRSYLKEYPMLSAAEQKKYAVAAQNGNKEAFDYLVLSNGGMVYKLANKYLDYGLDHEELFQIGTIGLIKAIKLFDTSQNTNLSTYAHWIITQAMLRSIQNLGRTIRIPVYLYQKNFKQIVTNKKLEQELGRTPTSQEIAEVLNTTEKDVDKSKRDMLEVCSLNVIMTASQTGTEMSEQVRDKKDLVGETLDKMCNVKMIKEIKGALRETEYKIFMDHAVGGKTYAEIAVGLECTSQNVHRIYKDCLSKLKKDDKVSKYKMAQ